jgi:hypothetical protein
VSAPTTAAAVARMRPLPRPDRVMSMLFPSADV